MRRFKPFYGMAKPGFRANMIKYWMENEGYQFAEEALRAYGGADFEKLCKLVECKIRKYNPDIGYTDKKIDGTLCFESEDNNFCIPIRLIEVKGNYDN